VLAGVVIPTLVRAQHEDADDGLAFTQRLVTVSFVVPRGGHRHLGDLRTAADRPLLRRQHRGTIRRLTTRSGRLILPEILFYGIFGLPVGRPQRPGTSSSRPHGRRY